MMGKPSSFLQLRWLAFLLLSLLWATTGSATALLRSVEILGIPPLPQIVEDWLEAALLLESLK